MNRRILHSIVLTILLPLSNLAKGQSALGELPELIEFNAKNFSTNLETKKTEVEGNVHLRLGDRELFADSLSFDPTTGEVECAGAILFRQGSLEIEATGVKFNLRSGLGIFYNAAVHKPGAFKLEGKEIKRVAETVYEARVAKVSFCQDCPSSWSFIGDRVRIDTERYAELHHAVLQIKDTPLFYLPFIYYPAKDERFTGFLIPYFKFSPALGAQLGIPFYYAPRKDLDFTYDYRYMSKGGHRGEVVTRYVLSDYSFFNSRTSYIRTPAGSPWLEDRYGIHFESRMQVAKHWALLGRGDTLSDVEMSTNFEEDSVESRLPTVANDLYLEGNFENFSLNAGVTLPQDNVNRLVSARTSERWALPHVRGGIPSTPITNEFLANFRLDDLRLQTFADDPYSTSLTLTVHNLTAISDRQSRISDDGYRLAS